VFSVGKAAVLSVKPFSRNTAAQLPVKPLSLPVKRFSDEKQLCVTLKHLPCQLLHFTDRTNPAPMWKRLSRQENTSIIRKMIFQLPSLSRKYGRN
jgi:hypothetical protein